MEKISILSPYQYGSEKTHLRQSPSPTKLSIKWFSQWLNRIGAIQVGLDQTALKHPNYVIIIDSYAYRATPNEKIRFTHPTIQLCATMQCCAMKYHLLYWPDDS